MYKLFIVVGIVFKGCRKLFADVTGFLYKPLKDLHFQLPD